jgi:L-alanine-DL-glutamate epimerase-like enolase superfamily enzyme
MRRRQIIGNSPPIARGCNCRRADLLLIVFRNYPKPGIFLSARQLMAKITTLDTKRYRIPLDVTLTDATHGLMDAFELIAVRVSDADGGEGVGYTYTTGRNGGAVRNILAREIAEIVAGDDADLIEHLWSKVWWGLHYGGRGGAAVLALSALDIALWDLKAKRAHLPLWKLLGGNDAAVPCYAGGIDLELSAKDLIVQTDGNLKRGFRAIKMKVGRTRLSEDVSKLAALRAHLGEGFPLMVDANMKWTADDAIRAARAFQPYDPVWLEEPLIPDDVAGHVRVAREGGIPIATGENMRTLWEFKQMISAGGVTYPEPDVTNCGGVTVFMKIAHLAEAFNLPVTSHGAHDITVHLLAACSNRSYLEMHGFGLDRYIAEPLVLFEGLAQAPDRSGHGITFDWKGLDRLPA